MKKSIALVLLTAVVVGISAQALARGPGGMGGGMGGGGPHSPSSPPMPSQATTNSNAPWTGTQEKGLDRAQERMSDQGLEHEKATRNQDHRDLKPQTGRPAR